jgi:hypothetical protein
MDAGGMGLQLGREDVLHGNVAMWRAIAGRVSNIVVYACAAANAEREEMNLQQLTADT